MKRVTLKSAQRQWLKVTARLAVDPKIRAEARKQLSSHAKSLPDR